MRRAAVVFGLIAGLAIGVVAAIVGIATASAAAPAHASVTGPARLFVSAREYSLILSRQRLKSGNARIQLYNVGEDAHDLRLRRSGSHRSLQVAETEPGKVTEIKAVLRSGKWRLYCSLPGHAKAGMRATLTVAR